MANPTKTAPVTPAPATDKPAKARKPVTAESLAEKLRKVRKGISKLSADATDTTVKATLDGHAAACKRIAGALDSL